MTAGHIRLTNEAGVHVVALSGEHDISTTAPTLSAELDRLFDSGSRVVVDLARAEFIDSSVVNALIDAHMRTLRDAEHRIAIVVAPGSFPDRLLSLVGMSEIAPVFPTRAAALAAVSDA
jgi:anti-sigma B factor antagonist